MLYLKNVVLKFVEAVTAGRAAERDALLPAIATLLQVGARAWGVGVGVHRRGVRVSVSRRRCCPPLLRCCRCVRTWGVRCGRVGVGGCWGVGGGEGVGVNLRACVFVWAWAGLFKTARCPTYCPASSARAPRPACLGRMRLRGQWEPGLCGAREGVGLLG